MKFGYIYYMRIGETLKIGYTANPQQRLYNLRGTLIAMRRGTKKREAAEHRRFRKFHIRSEFFRDDPELVAAVAKIGICKYDDRPHVRLTFKLAPKLAYKLKAKAKAEGQLFSYYLRQCVLRDAGIAR